MCSATVRRLSTFKCDVGLRKLQANLRKVCDSGPICLQLCTKCKAVRDGRGRGIAEHDWRDASACGIITLQCWRFASASVSDTMLPSQAAFDAVLLATCGGGGGGEGAVPGSNKNDETGGRRAVWMASHYWRVIRQLLYR